MSSGARVCRVCRERRRYVVTSDVLFQRR